MLKNESAVEEKRYKAVMIGGNTITREFDVPDNLYPVLERQREGLDKVNPNAPGKERYTLAREAGCFAAVSKGAKDHTLKPDQMFIPGTELTQANGKVRVSALKLEIPEVDVRVKSITLLRLCGVWVGRMEVVAE